MPNNQTGSDKEHPTITQQGMHPQTSPPETVDSSRHAGDEKQSVKAQPRRFSQQEAQSIPADRDPDDPVSP